MCIRDSPTYTAIPGTMQASSVCPQTSKAASTEFMVTSTTVEHATDAGGEAIDATEREILQQSSTIIPCMDHGDEINGPQPIIAVIPPPETSDTQLSSTIPGQFQSTVNNGSNSVSCSSIATISSHSIGSAGKNKFIFLYQLSQTLRVCHWFEIVQANYLILQARHLFQYLNNLVCPFNL